MSDETEEVTKESLLSAAADFDAGKTTDEAPATKPEPKDENPAPDEGDDKTATAEEVAKDGKVNKDKAPTTDADKQKSKFAQNEERKTKTWEQINADKAAIKAEREALQREREEFQKQKKAPEVLRDEHNASAEDYRKAAEQFKAKGDTRMADAAEQLAQNLESKERALRDEQAMKEGRDKWTKNLTDLAEKHPDLKKPDSELTKLTLKVLETFPLLKRDPDGIKYAVRAAEIELQAKDFDGTKAEFNKLKAEHEKLQKKLSISGGSPTDPVPDAKSFKDMSLKEQRSALEQQVAQHDRDNGL